MSSFTESISGRVHARSIANSHRYDNCYANSTSEAADYSNVVAQSPTRFQVMASALDGTSRDIIYQICQWGQGTDIGVW